MASAARRSVQESWRESAKSRRFGGRAPIPEMLFFRFLHAVTIYANSAFGTRSPSRIAKRCKAAFQFCTGMVHFLAMCSRARYSSFIAASWLGNDPLVLITLRKLIFSDSTALVV